MFLFRSSLKLVKCFNYNSKKFLSSHNFDKYEIVIPKEYQYKERTFSQKTKLPSYYENFSNDDHLYDKNIIEYKNLSRNEEVINGVRKACEISKLILNNTKNFIKTGMTGEEIDDYVYQQCVNYNCYPSPYHYNGFPKCVSLSVNNVAIHGIPDQRKLILNDILKVDISIFYQGYHGDTAKTFLIGNNSVEDLNNLNKNLLNSKAFNLIKTAELCLNEAIKICKAELNLNEVGKLIESIAIKKGFNVVPAVCGHSIGEYLHGLPQIVHSPFDEYTEEDILLENMILTIEPVICENEPDVVLLEDGWTVCTEDNGRTAQFEHTILVKKNGSEILT